MDVPAGGENVRKLRVGQTRTFFLFSLFYPGFVHPNLRNLEKGIIVRAPTSDFSAKGRIVCVIEEWAVLDSGLWIVCQQNPSYFQQSGGEEVRRGMKEGDLVLETGALSVHFV